VVVDHEKDAGIAGDGAKAPREEQEVAAGQSFVAKLENFGTPTQGGCGQGRQAIGLLVGSDDVKAGGEELLQEALSRNGAKSTVSGSR
jgi:hypothetical protein